jgi:hypothetical protein
MSVFNIHHDFVMDMVAKKRLQQEEFILAKKELIEELNIVIADVERTTWVDILEQKVDMGGL